MHSARARIVVACLSGWLGFSSVGQAKVLGFTDNGSYGTPARERTEKSFALILPFGVGQFVQGRPLAGSLVLLAEAGLLGASYMSYAAGQAANRREKDYQATTCPADSAQCNPRQLSRYQSEVRSAEQAMVVLGFAALGTMIGGAVEAVLHERQWSLDIALAPAPSMSEPTSVATLDPVSSPTSRALHPSLVLDLKRLF